MRARLGAVRLSCAAAVRLSCTAAVLLSCAAAAPLPLQALALNRDGALALASGDLESAEARLALALEYSPRFTEAWVNLGLVELRRGNFERASRDFLKARELNPDLPVPHHALGVLADREGDGARAETCYRAALRVDPGFAPARADLGRRLFERGAYEEAREQFLRLTEVAPDGVDGWAGLCESLLQLQRTADASAALALAVARLGRPPRLALLDAKIMLRRGAFAEAESRLMREVLVDARGEAAFESEALGWLAIARLGQGDVPGACGAASRALSVDPRGALAGYAMSACRDARATPIAITKQPSVAGVR